MSYNFKNVGFHTLLHDISFTLPSCGLVTLIGPNGAGKSSLMKLMSAWHKASTGQIDYEGQNILHYKAWERAQKISWLPQEREVAWSLSVEQMVSLGEYNNPKASPDFIDDILQQTDLYELRRRPFHQLSGGEKNRAHLARLMATQTPTWLLDEIDAGLDWHYSFKIFSFLKELSQKKLIILILHDLNIAKNISDITLLMNKGHLAHWGQSQDVIKADILSEVWQIPITEGKDGWIKTALPFS